MTGNVYLPAVLEVTAEAVVVDATSDFDAAEEHVKQILSIEVLDAVSAFRNRSCAALLLRSLIDVGDVGPTPSVSPAPFAGMLAGARTVIAGLGCLLGEPVAYAEEKHGALVQQVFPVRSSELAPSNESSLVALDLHTELVFSRKHPDRPLDEASPDHLVLLCLRAGPDAPVTSIVDGRRLCAELTASDLEILRSPRFELQAPYSFTRDNDRSRPWLGPEPLVKGSADSLRLALDLACGTRAIDRRAERALGALREAAADPHVCSDVRLQAGDVLCIDNRRALHGRSAFEPAYDGADRWLLRMYVRSGSGFPDDHEPGEQRHVE